MKYLIIMIAVLVSGCGRNPQGIDPAFNQTLDRLDADFQQVGAKVATRSVSIQFGDTTQGGQYPDAKGICVQNVSGNYILVDYDAWQNYSDVFKEYLIAHEIGHCVLGKVHDAHMVQLQPFTPSVPESIMNPDADTAANWDERYHEYYFEQLTQ